MKTPSSRLNYTFMSWLMKILMTVILKPEMRHSLEKKKKSPLFSGDNKINEPIIMGKQALLSPDNEIINSLSQDNGHSLLPWVSTYWLCLGESQSFPKVFNFVWMGTMEVYKIEWDILKSGAKGWIHWRTINLPHCYIVIVAKTGFSL